MAGLRRPLLFGSTLLFLLSCDALLSDGPPTLLSTSQPSQPSPLSLMDLDQDVEEQPEMMTVPGSPTTVPGLTPQGQESSGLFNDDNKPLQSSVHLWDDVRDQVNTTGLDSKSLRGYSQTLSQTSTSPMEEPRKGNHTVLDAVEKQERELWEMERESSDVPLEAGYGQRQGLPTTTSNTSNTNTSNTTTTTTTTTTPTPNNPTPKSTTLDPQYVPVYGGSQSTPEDTVESDNTHTEDQEEEVVEEEEEAVVLGGPRSDSGRAGRGGEISPLTTVPLASLAPTVDFTEDSWDRPEDEEIQEKEQRQQQERRKEEERRNEEEEQAVICVDWSDLAGKGYVILNMSDNVDCAIDPDSSIVVLHCETTQEPFHCEATQEPFHREITQEPFHREITQESIHCETTQEPVHCEITQEPFHREITQEPFHCEATQEPFHCEITHKPFHREITQEPFHCETIQEPFHCEATQEPFHREITQEPFHREITQEPFHREITQESVHCETTQEPVHCEITQEPFHREITQEPFHCEATQEPFHCEITQEPFHCETTQEPFHREITQEPFHCEITQEPFHREITQEPFHCETTQEPFLSSDKYHFDDFRVESGDRLLELLETAFSRKMNSPQGSWLISLSKPTRQDHQLLITLASEHGVIATKDMLSMLGEIRRGLHEIGIQNYSSANTCHSRPSQMRSDYGKLFVVLVIIGSVCVVIIASGLIYIFWQRRLPKIKTMTRGEEFHFVENGCHDNPTLDVTSDRGGQPEMQEKKHRHANGLTAGSGGEGGSSGWQVLVNKPGGKEEDNMEEDTHL
eukprot:XP_013989547.1 PREDICTED: podocalyxin-like protein 2 [Salmo salar]